MNYEQIMNYVIAGIVSITTSGTAGAVISNVITSFKLKRLDPDLIASKLTANIENTTLKVAAAETVERVLTPVVDKVNDTIAQIQALKDIVVAQGKIIKSLASVYDKSDLLTEPQRLAIIDAVIKTDELVENTTVKATPKKEITAVIETKEHEPQKVKKVARI